MKNISDFKLIDSFKSENFPSVGKISIPKSNIMLKKNELLKFNGKNNNDTKINNSIYLGLNGNIYDVSYHGGDKFYTRNEMLHMIKRKIFDKGCLI